MFNVVGLMSSKLGSMPASESPTQTVVSSISKLLLKLYKTSAVFSSTFRKNAEVFVLISCQFGQCCSDLRTVTDCRISLQTLVTYYYL